MISKDTFVHFLVETGALKFGAFVTKSGRNTPYFINTGEFRTGKAISKLSEFYAEAFAHHFKGKASNLFGPAYKGIPLCTATAIALYERHGLDLSFTYNRKEAKDHGEGGNLVGDTYKTEKDVVIIEDVITAGTSVNETMQTMKSFPNAHIKGLLISVDRKERLENGKSALATVEETYGIEAHSIIDIDDIIAFLESAENRAKIGAPEDILEKVRAYRKEWGV
jgi:orotate phosphoribosyltransferase